MLKRAWRQWPNLRPTLFHTPKLPQSSNSVSCSVAKLNLSSTRLPSRWICTSRLTNLGWHETESANIIALPNFHLQLPRMCGLPYELPRHNSSSVPHTKVAKPRTFLQCPQLKSGGLRFSSRNCLLAAPALQQSSYPYSTFSSPLLLSGVKIRCKNQFLEAEKSSPSLTSFPFSSFPSKEEQPKTTLGKLKQMVKDYWYIIIPVEVALSILSYGSIYISLQSGLDIVSLLKSLGASEATLAKLPSAEAGYHALAFICYKVTSPLRHGISLAISTVVVARLEKTRPGYLRTSGQLAQEGKEKGREGVDYVKAKSEDAKERYEDAKERYEERKEDLKERYEDAKERYGDKREEMRDDMKERMERLNKLYQSMKRR